MPKESMPAIAARIEVVFMLLVGVVGFLRLCSNCLGDSVEDDRAKKTLGSKQEASFIHNFDGIWVWSPSVLPAKKDFFVSCHAQLLARWSLSELCVTGRHRLSYLAQRRTHISARVLGTLSENIAAVLRTCTAPP